MRVILCAAIVGAALVAACHGPIVTPLPGDPPGSVGISFPQSIVHGQQGSIEVVFLGGFGATTVTSQFSGGIAGPLNIVHELPSGVNTDSYFVTFTGSASGNVEHTLTVTVVDSNGDSTVGIATFTVPRANQPPAVSAVASDENEVTVTVDDPEGDRVTLLLDRVDGGVDVTPPPPAVVEDGHGTVVLRVTPNSFFGPETGPIKVLAGDEHGAVSTTEVTITAVMAHLAMDTLYAIPLDTHVSVGEPVRIVVATSATAHPFLYMTGVRVTFPTASGVDYVNGSFNFGAVGGDRYASDGLWEQLGATQFLTAAGGIDFWFGSHSNAGGGLVAFDANVTPLDGTATAGAEGELFNFEVTFTGPGSWPITFQDVNVVNRTYYNDHNQAPDYFWSDISNDHPGIPNTITVVP